MLKFNSVAAPRTGKMVGEVERGAEASSDFDKAPSQQPPLPSTSKIHLPPPLVYSITGLFLIHPPPRAQDSLAQRPMLKMVLDPEIEYYQEKEKDQCLSLMFHDNKVIGDEEREKIYLAPGFTHHLTVKKVNHKLYIINIFKDDLRY